MSLYRKYELQRLLNKGRARTFLARRASDKQEVYLHLLAGSGHDDFLRSVDDRSAVEAAGGSPPVLESGDFGGTWCVVTRADPALEDLDAWLEAESSKAADHGPESVPDASPAPENKPATPPSAPDPVSSQADAPTGGAEEKYGSFTQMFGMADGPGGNETPDSESALDSFTQMFAAKMAPNPEAEAEAETARPAPEAEIAKKPEAADSPIEAPSTPTSKPESSEPAPASFTQMFAAPAAGKKDPEQATAPAEEAEPESADPATLPVESPAGDEPEPGSFTQMFSAAPAAGEPKEPVAAEQPAPPTEPVVPDAAVDTPEEEPEPAARVEAPAPNPFLALPTSTPPPSDQAQEADQEEQPADRVVPPPSPYAPAAASPAPPADPVPGARSSRLEPILPPPAEEPDGSSDPGFDDITLGPAAAERIMKNLRAKGVITGDSGPQSPPPASPPPQGSPIESRPAPESSAPGPHRLSEMSSGWRTTAPVPGAPSNPFGTEATLPPAPEAPASSTPAPEAPSASESAAPPPAAPPEASTPFAKPASQAFTPAQPLSPVQPVAPGDEDDEPGAYTMLFGAEPEEAQETADTPPPATPSTQPPQPPPSQPAVAPPPSAQAWNPAAAQLPLPPQARPPVPGGAPAPKKSRNLVYALVLTGVFLTVVILTTLLLFAWSNYRSGNEPPTPDLAPRFAMSGHAELPPPALDNG